MALFITTVIPIFAFGPMIVLQLLKLVTGSMLDSVVVWALANYVSNMTALVQVGTVGFFLYDIIVDPNNSYTNPLADAAFYVSLLVESIFLQWQVYETLPQAIRYVDPNYSFGDENEPLYPTILYALGIITV